MCVWRLLFFPLLPDYLYAETNNEIILRRNIFKDYNPRIRPVLQQNDTVTVIFGMSLHQIIDLVGYTRARAVFV